MKVKNLNSISDLLEENFDNENERRKHFRKHVTKDGGTSDPKYPDMITFTWKQFPNQRVYEEAADKFARTPITNSDIEGYIRTRDNKYMKYNKKTQEFTVYSIEHGQPVNITYFPCTIQQWKDIQYKYPYSRDIDPKKDAK